MDLKSNLEFIKINRKKRNESKSSQVKKSQFVFSVIRNKTETRRVQDYLTLYNDTALYFDTEEHLYVENYCTFLLISVHIFFLLHFWTN